MQTKYRGMDSTERWDRKIAIVVLGDGLVFLAFALFGSFEHGATVSDTLYRTAMPFGVVWFLGSPWFGSYRSSTLNHVRTTLWRIPLLWLAFGVVGFFARSILMGQSPVFIFAVIAIGVQGVLLIAWRSMYVLANRRFSK